MSNPAYASAAQPKAFLVATFSDAVRAVRGENLPVYDVYAPYPIHGLDHAMGIRPTRLPWVTLGAALAGVILALSFQFYTNVLDWGMNVGGKPDNSTLAFVPISFELMVLLAGLATVAALFLRARLYPGARPCLLAEGVTDHVFALAIRRRAAPEMERARRILEQSGAEEIAERVAAL